MADLRLYPCLMISAEYLLAWIGACDGGEHLQATLLCQQSYLSFGSLDLLEL